MMDTTKTTDGAEAAKAAERILNGEVLSPKQGLKSIPLPEVLEPDANLCELIMREGTGITVFGKWEDVWKQVEKARVTPSGTVEISMPKAEDSRRFGTMLASEFVGAFDAGTHGDFWAKQHARRGGTGDPLRLLRGL